MLLNPILLTIAILIVFLKMTHISYETYNEGGHLIEFWLKPAVVALGVPLYLQLETIKKQLLPIMLSQLAGCIVGVISVVLIAKLMGASDEIIYSLAPKSVTTPIAMEVTKSLGGIPSLTAAVVVCVGLLGGILGFKTMKLTHIGSPMAQGLSLGAAAHAVGTSTAMDISRKYGAFASLGLTLNGIFTALLTPTILRILIPFYILYIVYFLFLLFQSHSVHNIFPEGIPAWRIVFTFLGMDSWVSMHGISTFSLTIGEWFLGCLILLYLIFPLLRFFMIKSEKFFFIIATGIYLIVLFHYVSPRIY